MPTASNGSKWGTLLSCSLSCFVVWLDFAIVNTALPAIQESLSASIIQLQWVINAFIFAITVLIVTFGRLADHLGRRLMNIWGVVCFGLFSLLAGISTTPEWLIIFRFLQGAASAAIIPSALSLISHAFPGKEKGKAIGIWSGIGGVGMAAGPAVGGFLVSALSWRWIFYINVPLAIISSILSALFARESRLKSGGQTIDFKGFLFLIVGLGSLTFYLMHAPDWGWTSEKSLLLAVCAVIFLVWFYISEQRSSSPIIPFSLLLNHDFFLPTAVMFGLSFVFTSNLFLIPLYLIQVRTQAPWQAGLMILSITACIAILSPIVGHLMAKLSAKTLILVGLIFFCVSTILQIFFETDSSIYFVLAPLILLGIGWGIARTPTTATAIASAPHHFAGTATGVLWSVQNAAGVISIAIVLTIFRKVFETTSSPESFMAGYRLSMWILSAITVAVILLIASCMRERSKKNATS
jgi:EmrB/QacA subfamily drug resistance transporter